MLAPKFQRKKSEVKFLTQQQINVLVKNLEFVDETEMFEYNDKIESAITELKTNPQAIASLLLQLN
jgi:lipoate synthase